ncbi:MAG: DUF4159 domain-containing protein [Planctomycetes bacterium]|nr:DUF4159 domain-containing protein [Planctomycetota bacterium]
MAATATAGLKVTVPPSDRQVDSALNRAVDWLKNQQAEDGSWPGHHRRYADGGRTALAAWALLAAGEEAGQPNVDNARTYLNALDPGQTNARALRALFSAAIGRDARTQLDADIHWLMAGQRGDGGWAERRDAGPSNTFSTSLAILALSDAKQASMTIPPEHWRRAATFLTATANDDGGFGHYPPGAEPVRVRGMSHGSATAAAAAAAGAIRRDGTAQIETTQRRALSWLATHYNVNRVPVWPWGDRPDFAYRYFLIRSPQTFSPLVLAGRTLDNELARRLLSAQQRDGHFNGQPLAESDVVATAWAALALAEARRPLLVNRVLVGAHRPASASTDMARATAWVQRELGIDAGWRDVPADAPLQLLRQAPILVLTGRGAFSLPASARETIARYLQAGGTVLIGPAGEDPVFARTADEWFRALMDGYGSAALPDDHPLLRVSNDIQGLAITAIASRARRRVFLLPGRVTMDWQRGYDETTADAFELLANVVTFVTGGAVDGRKFDPTLQRAPAIEPERFIDIGRLMHDGDWNASAGAAEALSRALAAAISVGVRSRDVRPNQDIPKDLMMLWLTGSKLDGLMPVHRENIDDYVNAAGGLLLVDAAYGDEAFYEDALEQVELIFGSSSVKPLTVDHPLLTGRFGGGIGSDVTTVTYSRNARQKLGRADGAPRLFGVEKEGRVVAVLSPMALSAPAEGDPPYDAYGYVSDDARRIVLNVILYAYAARHNALAD